MSLSRILSLAAGDLRIAARSLRKSPLFALVAVITLALGVGPTTAILSVVNGVLLRSLPYANADQLVVVLHDGRDPVAPANLLDWRDRTHSFSAMEAAEYWTPDATGGENPEQINALHVTPGMFSMLGVPPLLGRTFTRDDERRGDDHLVVIGYGLWQRRFAGDRSVVGKTLPLNGQIYTITGVMPQTFQFAPFWATHAELWAPLSFGARATSRDGQSLRVFARLRPGVSMASARSDVAAVTATLERQYPGTNQNVIVTSLKEMTVGNVRTPLMLLFIAVAFVLLIACVNVAHMLLARGAARNRELAVRMALGGSRTRLIAQLLAESALLATIGGILGIALAALCVRALAAASPSMIPRVAAVTIDARVLLISIGMTALTAVTFGLLPALRATQVDLASSFRAGDRSGQGDAEGRRLRDLLVASEFALSLVLLVAAGLMIRSFAALRHVDPGFDPRGVVAMTVSTNGTSAADSSRHAAFYTEAVERARATPGVTSASYINHLPLAGDVWNLSFRLEGQPVPKPGQSAKAVYRVVFPGYFETMRLPVLQGRDITDADRMDAPRVVVINEFTARRHWPGQNAVGQRIALGGDSTWITVVGVVKNAVRDTWSAPPSEEAYFPFFQSPGYMKGTGPTRTMTLVARTSCVAERCDGSAIAPRIRDAVRAIEPHAPISQILAMSAVVAGATAETSFYLSLLGVFAAIATVLAAVGIYGVMSYAVSKRTHEIGVRMALGADPRTVLGSVLGHGLRTAASGAFVGVALSLVATRFMRGILFGVSPIDAPTVIVAAATLLGTALLASLIPARRATTIDPVQALRG